MGLDWISRRAFGSRGDRGGGVEARIGLEESGEDLAGRYGLDAGNGVVLSEGRAWSPLRYTEMGGMVVNMSEYGDGEGLAVRLLWHLLQVRVEG